MIDKKGNWLVIENVNIRTNNHNQKGSSSGEQHKLDLIYMGRISKIKDIKPG